MSDLQITIRCQVDGFETSIGFVGDVEQLKRITARLRAIGVEPVTTPARTQDAGRKPKAPRIDPAYDAGGNAICPNHGTQLRDGQWGKYCPHKDRETGQYCRNKFTDA
jgi:hypothetical protein